MDKEVHLESWSIVRLRAVEEESFHLVGIVFGHPIVTDGHAIMTSQIVYMDPDASECRTRNTLYALGLSCSEVKFKKMFHFKAVMYAARIRGMPAKVTWMSIDEWKETSSMHLC